MDKLHATMLKTCDRLLLLVTGPHAAADPGTAQAALAAIAALQLLEGRLKGTSNPAAIDLTEMAPLLHDGRVSGYVTEVVGILRDEGLFPSGIALIRH